MVTVGEPYVERTQKALVESLILADLSTAPRTIDQLWNSVKGITWTDKVDRDLVESSATRLTRDGHAKKEEDRYVITDDGREDVQKVEPILREVSARLAEGVTSTTRTKP